jgi:hypothetical protein
MDLSKQSNRGLIQIWRNAVEQQNDPAKQKQARAMIQLIGEEWKSRRSQGPWFSWPSTDAPPGNTPIEPRSWPEEGMLGALGYHVGETQGVKPAIRQQILREIVDGELPPLNSYEYAKEWGEPGTTDRLRKLAETLASLTRNEKRRRQVSLGRAVEEREADLRMLHDEYYKARFNFGWPDSEI